MINNEMTQKESYWRNFLDGNIIVYLCNLNSNVKEIIETLIIENEDIKQYLDTIYKINDTETIQEILDILSAVCAAFCTEINLENILKRFEIYPEQRQNLFEDEIGYFPIIAIKPRENNGFISFIIQIIRLIYGIILFLLGEERCHKQILIPDLGLVDIKYVIYTKMKDEDIICVLFLVENLMK